MAEKRKKRLKVIKPNVSDLKKFKALGRLTSFFYFHYGIIDRYSIIIISVAFKFKTKEENIYISFVKLPIFRNFINFLQGMTPIYTIQCWKISAFYTTPAFFVPIQTLSVCISNLLRITEIIIVEIHYEITKCVERHVTTQQRWQWIMPVRGKLCVSHEKSHHFDDCRTLHTALESTLFPLSISTATTIFFVFQYM